MTLHTLENERWQVGILPETGSSIAYGRVKVDDGWSDVLRPTSESDYGNASLCSSFIMLPWANRIANAKFRFHGHEYQLREDHPGVAAHGATRHLAWEVERASLDRIVTRFDSRDYPDVNFPFKFSARSEYRLEDDDLQMELTLTNDDDQPFPGGFGHHPYFVRDAANAVQVQLLVDARFELDNSIVVAPPIPLTDYYDFRDLRPLGASPYDDLYTNRTSQTLYARVVYPNVAVDLLADPMFEQVILYAPEGKPFFALEPQSNVNDGFNLYDRGMEKTGVFVLEPGELKTGLFGIHVVDRS